MKITPDTRLSCNGPIKVNQMQRAFSGGGRNLVDIEG
jgi:hypothetical protein